MNLVLLLFLPSFFPLLTSVNIKKCQRHFHTIKESQCEWNCGTAVFVNTVLMCQSDGLTLATCTGDGDCFGDNRSRARCEKTLCTSKIPCRQDFLRVCIGNASDWSPLPVTESTAVGKETVPSRGGKTKPHESSWKCWSIIWAMGTFAVACFVLQCAAFNMYKARRKRTAREAECPPFGGQPQVVPSAPPMAHPPTPVRSLETHRLQPQVVYVSDRPPAYEVVLQLSDHPPPYSSL